MNVTNAEELSNICQKALKKKIYSSKSKKTTFKMINENDK